MICDISLYVEAASITHPTREPNNVPVSHGYLWIIKHIVCCHIFMQRQCCYLKSWIYSRPTLFLVKMFFLCLFVCLFCHCLSFLVVNLMFIQWVIHSTHIQLSKLVECTALINRFQKKWMSRCLQTFGHIVYRERQLYKLIRHPIPKLWALICNIYLWNTFKYWRSPVYMSIPFQSILLVNT